MEATTRNVPGKVKKLMRKERIRNLRESYCSLLEEQLEVLNEKHWGLSLEKKMEKYPQEAYRALRTWAIQNGIEWEYQNTPWRTFQLLMQTAMATATAKQQLSQSNSSCHSQIEMAIAAATVIDNKKRENPF